MPEPQEVTTGLSRSMPAAVKLLAQFARPAAAVRPSTAPWPARCARPACGRSARRRAAPDRCRRNGPAAAHRRSAPSPRPRRAHLDPASPRASIVEIGVEDARRDPWSRSVGHRPTRGLPAVDAAVEHEHFRRAHDAEHPPDARRREHARPVIDDDRVVAEMPIEPTCWAKTDGVRQRVRQLGARLHHLVLVEEHGARNVRRLVLGPRVALLRRQVPGGVDDRQARLVEGCPAASRRRQRRRSSSLMS